MSRIITERNDLADPCLAAGGFRWFRRDEINHIAVGIKRCPAYTGHRGKWECFAAFGVRDAQSFVIRGTYADCVRHAHHMLRTRVWGTAPARIRKPHTVPVVTRRRESAPVQLLLAFAVLPVRFNTSSDVCPTAAEPCRSSCYSGIRRPSSLG
jgi:hypothetical protein